MFVYCGHNEFVEGGFAMELRERWRHPLLMDVGLRLSRMRLVNVIASAMRGGAEGTQKPKVRVQRGNAFRSLNYRHTRVFFDVYRENLAAICRNAEGYGARVLISTVIGSMIDGPTVA